MATSFDALATKIYASKLNYFNDPYVKLFADKNTRKMYPIINRGTWARVQAYRQTIANFIQTFLIERKLDVNIVSLGAGFDTTHFWLQDVLAQQGPDLGKKVCYVEIDYDQVVAKKIYTIT